MGTENKTFGVAEAVLLHYPCVQIGCKALVRGSELRECETAQRGLTQRTPGTTEISLDSSYTHFITAFWVITGWNLSEIVPAGTSTVHCYSWL